MRIRAIAVGRLVALVTLACLWSASGVQAAILSTPTGVNPGDQFRFIFVTSTTTQATSGNASTYNTVAQNAGNSLLYDDDDLDLLAETFQWFALVSTTGGQSANSIVPIPINPLDDIIPIYLIDGSLVALNSADLWNGSISTAIDLTEAFGVPSHSQVWTGSSSDGSPSGTGALGSTNPVVLGRNDLTTAAWIDESSGLATAFRPIYAISQVLTAPSFASPSVPEPTSLAMLAMAGVGVLGGRSLRRRKVG